MCAQGDDYEGLQWRCSLIFVSGNYITFTVSKIMMIHYPKRFSPRWKSMSTRLVKSQYDAMITSSMFSMKFFVYWSWWRNWKDDEEDTNHESQWCALNICWFHTSRCTILNSILHLKILYHDLITPKVLILFATVLESYSASVISNHLTSKWYGQSLSHYLNEIFSLEHSVYFRILSVYFIFSFVTSLLERNIVIFLRIFSSIIRFRLWAT